ncbi:MAG: hypothetical protein A2285_09940 [Elusimicrobia bacterium RIFOXYA12_FULL_57_11]|nr:MAG: hypothetical protein A2285_09940 [Elusimicrobia bacterium RIFOXYA12_FULL_57_11]
MGAGVWYYLSRRAPREKDPSPPPAFEQSTRVKAGGNPVPPPGAPMPSLTLEILGPPAFVSQVTQALKLVWTADRETFLFLKSAIYIIRNEDKTGFYLDGGRPVAAISKDHAFRSRTWCAGIIAHQAWHSWYAMKAARKNKRLAPPLPGQKNNRVLVLHPRPFDYKGLGSILDMENRASAFQLEVMEKVGAPASEKKAVFRRAPRDFTTGHDGNYSLNP